MTTMNVSLPAQLKQFVDEQANRRGYASSSEFVRELIRREQDRESLRGLLLEGLASGPGRLADADYFDKLRQRLREDPGAANQRTARPADPNLS